MSPVSKAQQKAVAKYEKENYDKYQIRFKKGSKQALQAIATEQGESINGYIKSAITTRYEADTGKPIDL